MVDDTEPIRTGTLLQLPPLRYSRMSSASKAGSAKGSQGETKPDKKRGLGFSKTELHNLLDTMEAVLPICSVEWQTVEREHAALWPEEHM
jgi:hypothetical protein